MFNTGYESEFLKSLFFQCQLKDYDFQCLNTSLHLGTDVLKDLTRVSISKLIFKSLDLNHDITRLCHLNISFKIPGKHGKETKIIPKT